MSFLPSVRSILPSLHIKEGTVTLSVTDVRNNLPSLKIDSDSRDVTNGVVVTMSVEDLRKVLRVALATVHLDEKWYVAQVPGLAEALQNGDFESAADHYQNHGFLEGRPPEKPSVDEDYYIKTYPDVAQAIKAGKLKSGYEHFVTTGYAEGRSPTPQAK